MNPFAAAIMAGSGCYPPSDCPSATRAHLPTIEDDRDASLDWLLDCEESTYIRGMLERVGCRHSGTEGVFQIWKCDDGKYQGEFFAYRQRVDTFKDFTIDEAIDRAYEWYVRAGSN